MSTRLLTALLLASLLPAAGAGTLSAERRTLFFGHDDRVRVHPDHGPWQAIGQLETASGNLCTATLVAPDVALTAGHCFVGPHGRLDPALRFTLALDGQNSTRHAAARRVWLDRRLLRGLIRQGDDLIVPPAVARYDVAFVRLDAPLLSAEHTVVPFDGDRAALRQALTRASWRVNQAGYPEDFPDRLMLHRHCRATRLEADGRLAHRCDTLPGDSGSPLLLEVAGQPRLVAIQSSAPDARWRHRADNMALSTPAFLPALRRFLSGPK
ncbi:trypsin-like serine peptidase [Pseudogulbenkiania subflava]|uniref:Protease YdgD n=1 Tax=Pseudogulbenkiania subflava DSM 22618 TaxID=1123014 RepID=A0A1Y6C1Y9_9NEIS|nr:trypsin-like serine protease [Pseudogulbenkiania subflava]SMF39822.1 protease YdgD [Pseudogulbenkiania subflava DSM 22618]